MKVDFVYLLKIWCLTKTALIILTIPMLKKQKIHLKVHSNRSVVHSNLFKSIWKWRRNLVPWNGVIVNKKIKLKVSLLISWGCLIIPLPKKILSSISRLILQLPVSLSRKIKRLLLMHKIVKSLLQEAFQITEVHNREVQRNHQRKKILLTNKPAFPLVFQTLMIKITKQMTKK